MIFLTRRVFPVCLLLVLSSALGLANEKKGFTEDFIHNYDKQDFTAQVNLVKANKNIIGETINILTRQALAENVGVDEKMHLLNIASSMAYMHFHWNGDNRPLDSLDKIISVELKKEQARLDTLLQGQKSERMLGNFVMGRHEKAMQEQDLSMVLYPHWLHRIMFECKVCHNSIFKMQRWSNNISQEDIVKGKQCGVCHNGKMAFSATENCQRCHLAGRPEAEQLHKPSSVSQEKIKKAAEKIGAKWRPENLPDGKLPLDRFQFIDWLELKRRNVFTPIVSLDKNYKDETRDNKILFKAKSNFVNDVLFDHKVHADWIKCSSCHPAIFTEKLGSNNIKMMDMHKGRYCGYCHSKVSFAFADCKRCHKDSNNHPPDTVLIRPRQ